MTKIEVLQRAQTMGAHGASSDDTGLYTCHECGSQWQARRRWLWWPIRLGWATQNRSWRSWFKRHGVEGRADGIEQRVFAQVWSIGRLRIVFGRY